MNRPFAGIYPAVSLDLKSTLPLYISSFIGKKGINDSYTAIVLEAVEFLKECGIRVISLVADRAFTSIELLKTIEDGKKKKKKKKNIMKMKMKYVLPLKVNSQLKEQIPDIRKWYRSGKALVGMKKNVMYEGVMTNLLVVKKKKRTFMYVTNYNGNPAGIIKRYRERGKHECFFGKLSCMGFHNKPGNSLEKIKGHSLLCLSLEYILEILRKEMNLKHMDIKSFRSLLARPGYVWNDDEGRLNTIIIVNRALMKRMGRSTIETQDMRIRLIEYRGRITV